MALGAGLGTCREPHTSIVGHGSAHMHPFLVQTSKEAHPLAELIPLQPISSFFPR